MLSLRLKAISKSALPCLAIMAFAVLPNGYANAIERVSISSAGEQGDGESALPRTNLDGRFVVFTSFASNLVVGDTNNASDVFVRDRITGITERVSVTSEEAEVRGESFGGSISDDGRFVAFTSRNLDPQQRPDTLDVFLRDRELGTTQLISVSASGVAGNAQSSDAVVSADGRFVAFNSFANNLLPTDVFGLNVYVRDLSTGTLEKVNSGDARDCASPVLNADGRFVAYVCSLFGAISVFVTDRTTGQMEVVSVKPDGTVPVGDVSASADIDASGRFVVFKGRSEELVPNDSNSLDDVFVRDRQLKTTELISVGITGRSGSGGSSFLPKISANGRYVAFVSQASDLTASAVSPDGDVYIRDRKKATTTRVTANPNVFVTGNEGISGLDISSDATTVAFSASTRGLIPEDTNGVGDVFVEDLVVEVEPEFVPFAAFQPESRLITSALRRGDEIYLSGSFKVSPTGNGLDFGADDVAISLADVDGSLFRFESPAGSFSRFGVVTFRNEPIQGSSGFLQITRSAIPNTFFFLLTVKQLDLRTAKSPLTVSLRIGDDLGSTATRCNSWPRVQICK